MALKKDGMGLLGDARHPQDLLANRRGSARGPAAWLWLGVCSVASLDSRGLGRTSQVGWAPAEKAERLGQKVGHFLGSLCPDPNPSGRYHSARSKGERRPGCQAFSATAVPRVRETCDFLEVGKG